MTIQTKQTLLLLKVLLVLMFGGWAKLIVASPGLDSKPRSSVPADLLIADEQPAKKVSPLRQDKRIVGNSNLWDRIRGNFKLQRPVANPLVQAKLRSYWRHPKQFDRTIKRGTPFLYYLVEEINRRRLPMELVLLPIVESTYNPYAISTSQAVGLWQLLPRTADHLELKRNMWYEGRRDVHASTHAALNYLEYLNKRFKGNWLMAIAAYNIGEGTVDKAIEKNRQAGKSTDLWALDLPPVAHNYVASLLALSELVAKPGRYSMRLAFIPNRPYLAKVNLENQTDLSWVAHASSMKVDELYFLNPGLNRWATPPGGPHYLLLPINKAKQLRTELSHKQSQQLFLAKHVLPKQLNPFVYQNLPVDDAADKQQVAAAGAAVSAATGFPILRRIQYMVKSGDSLLGIAKRFGVNVQQILAWNKLPKNTKLKVGAPLTLHVQAEKASAAV